MLRTMEGPRLPLAAPSPLTGDDQALFVFHVGCTFDSIPTKEQREVVLDIFNLFRSLSFKTRRLAGIVEKQQEEAGTAA